MIDDMPPGFRFYPTEAELVSFYLHHKLEGNREGDLNRLMDRVISVVNIYDFNPWELPQFSEYLCHRDPEQWFFFVPRQESEVRGRPNRLTNEGYWKAAGSPGFVYSSNRPIGEKRTMVFYKGRAPIGRKTEWKMNEYKAIDAEASTSTGATLVVRQEFSLCRLYKKSKSIRSFDRRPPPPPPPLSPREVVIGNVRAQQGDCHGGQDAITTSDLTSHQMPGSTSSLESSSSGDQGQTLQNGENSNMALAVGSDNDQLWWDWDQFNLFCDMIGEM